MNDKLKKKLKILTAAIAAAILVYLFINGSLYSSIKNIFSSTQGFKKFVIAQGVWAPLVFFILQVAQVIISPVPGNVTTLAGGALFGGLNSSLLSGLAITIGSIIAFCLAKSFGKPLVIRLIGKLTYDKYSKVFLEKGKITIFLLFLLPFFPDDALCFLAGLSDLNLKQFIIYTIIGRLPSTIVASFTGAGALCLSINGWIIIGIISVIAIYFIIRYGKLIENILYSKIHFE